MKSRICGLSLTCAAGLELITMACSGDDITETDDLNVQDRVVRGSDKEGDPILVDVQCPAGGAKSTWPISDSTEKYHLAQSLTQGPSPLSLLSPGDAGEPDWVKQYYAVPSFPPDKNEPLTLTTSLIYESDGKCVQGDTRILNSDTIPYTYAAYGEGQPVTDAASAFVTVPKIWDKMATTLDKTKNPVPSDSDIDFSPATFDYPIHISALPKLGWMELGIFVSPQVGTTAVNTSTNCSTNFDNQDKFGPTTTSHFIRRCITLRVDPVIPEIQLQATLNPDGSVVEKFLEVRPPSWALTTEGAAAPYYEGKWKALFYPVTSDTLTAMQAACKMGSDGGFPSVEISLAETSDPTQEVSPDGLRFRIPAGVDLDSGTWLTAVVGADDSHVGVVACSDLAPTHDLDGDGITVEAGDCNDLSAGESGIRVYVDGDGDGVGDASDGGTCLTEGQDVGANQSIFAGDCNDADGGVFPLNEEVCDIHQVTGEPIDNNCDGIAALSSLDDLVDLDGDGIREAMVVDTSGQGAFTLPSQALTCATAGVRSVHASADIVLAIQPGAYRDTVVVPEGESVSLIGLDFDPDTVQILAPGDDCIDTWCSVLTLLPGSTTRVEGLRLSGGTGSLLSQTSAPDALRLGGLPQIPLPAALNKSIAESTLPPLRYGGAVWADRASLVLDRVVMRNNSAHIGAALAVWDSSSVKISNTQIEDTTIIQAPLPPNTSLMATLSGAMWFSHSQVQVDHLQLVDTIAENEPISSYIYGTGLTSLLSDLTLIESEISHQTGHFGGGLTVVQGGGLGSTSVYGSAFTDNLTFFDGAGILWLDLSTQGTSSSQLVGNLIAGNTSLFAIGGGAQIMGLPPSLSNLSFTNNVALGPGAGLALTCTSQPTLLDFVMWDHNLSSAGHDGDLFSYGCQAPVTLPEPIEWKESTSSKVDPNLANTVNVRGCVFVAEQNHSVDCDQPGTWDFNAWSEGIEPGEGCHYQGDGNLVWTPSDFVNISALRWDQRDYHLTEKSSLLNAVPHVEGEDSADMGPFGGPLAGYGLGPSTHNCLESGAFPAGTYLGGSIQYRGQLGSRDGLAADTGEIADLHLVWLHTGQVLKGSASSGAFQPQVKIYAPSALEPTWPVDETAMPCQQSLLFLGADVAEVSVYFTALQDGWYGLQVSARDGRMGAYELKVGG